MNWLLFSGGRCGVIFEHDTFLSGLAFVDFSQSNTDVLAFPAPVKLTWSSWCFNINSIIKLKPCRDIFKVVKR